MTFWNQTFVFHSIDTNQLTRKPRRYGVSLLFTFGILMLIGLSVKADHEELSGWPFPVPESIAMMKINSTFGVGYGSNGISAQDLVEIVSDNTSIEGLIYWPGVTSAIETILATSGSPDPSQVKQALVRSERVWEDPDALDRALTWLNNPMNDGSFVNSFTVEDIHQLVMQNYSVDSASTQWGSITNDLQHSHANTSSYNFDSAFMEVEIRLTYDASTWPFSASVDQALAEINDPDNDPSTPNNDLTVEELMYLVEGRIAPQGSPFLPIVDWQMVAADINSSGGATGSLSPGRLLHALGILYWPQNWAPQESALGYLNDPDNTPDDPSDDNSFIAEELLYLLYSSLTGSEGTVNWADISGYQYILNSWQILSQLNSQSSSLINGGRTEGNNFSWDDLRNMLGWDPFPDNVLEYINANSSDSISSADLMVAFSRNHMAGIIGGAGFVNFTDWAGMADQLGITENQLNNAPGREVNWPFPVEQSTAMSILNDRNSDGQPDFFFNPRFLVQIVKNDSNPGDYGVAADWNIVSQILSAPTWDRSTTGGTISETTPWNPNGLSLSADEVKSALLGTPEETNQPLWLFPVSSEQTLLFLNDPYGTTSDSSDDNTFDESYLIVTVSDNTTEGAQGIPIINWAGVTSSLNTDSTSYQFTVGEMIEAFGLWEYLGQPIPVPPDQALSNLNDPDQDLSTSNGTLTIEALNGYISSSMIANSMDWSQLVGILQANELSGVEYRFTTDGQPVIFQYNQIYLQAALGLYPWDHGRTPIEALAILNDPDFDGADENNFNLPWLVANYHYPQAAISPINDPDSNGVNDNYWTVIDLYWIFGWQPQNLPWSYSIPIEEALSQLNDPDQDDQSVAKFTPGSLYGYDIPSLRTLTVETVSGPVTNWQLLAQKLSELGADGYTVANVVSVPSTADYIITVEQLKEIFAQPDTTGRGWPENFQSEELAMDGLNDPDNNGTNDNNFTVDFVLDLIEAYSSNGITDWVGVASALNQDGISDGTIDFTPDNNFSGDPSMALFLPSILTGEQSGHLALESISIWAFPADETEALSKINQVSRKVNGMPIVYEDFTAYDIISYVSQSTGSLSQQTDWETVAVRLNQYASAPPELVFNDFTASFVKSALGFLSWDFPVVEVEALARLNSIGSLSGEATNTFTTQDVLSALDHYGFTADHVVEFDFQLAADWLNGQETDNVGQINENQPLDSLFTALYWNFPPHPVQALEYFNDPDQDGNQDNSFDLKDLLQAVNFESWSDMIDWVAAANQLNELNSSDSSNFTAEMVSLGFEFGGVGPDSAESAADSPLGTAVVNLMPGINMISLPNQPEDPYTARSLIELIHQSKYPQDDGVNLVPGGNVTDVNWLIRYDLVDQKFRSYVWSIDNLQAGFDIEGGQGYIVNVSSARSVQFVGTVWDGILNPLAPSLEPKRPQTWAFILLGQLPPQLTSQLDNHSVRVTNLQTGRQLAETTGLQPQFRLPMVDSLQQSIVHQGDLIRVEVCEPSGQRVADAEFVIGTEELATAYRRVNLQYNPIPDLTRLRQNYPNPFNPETWIPFDLSQEGEVKITIYDLTGHQVRLLPMGRKPAGIYHSQQRAAYWDGKTETGESVASGIYFYSIQTEDHTETRRMVILK